VYIRPGVYPAFLMNFHFWALKLVQLFSNGRLEENNEHKSKEKAQPEHSQYHWVTELHLNDDVMWTIQQSLNSKFGKEDLLY